MADSSHFDYNRLYQWKIFEWADKTLIMLIRFKSPRNMITVVEIL